MKLEITIFVLILTLIVNPMAFAGTSIGDTESSTMSQMPCHTELQQSQLADQEINTESDCPMHCCSDDGCSMDQSCLSCLNLSLVNAVLLEATNICFFYSAQKSLELTVGYLSDRAILPEIHPPDSSSL